MNESNLLAAAISWQHVHPVLVHFTTALLPASFFSDAVGKYSSRCSLNQAAFWMLLYAAIATPLTAAAGLMWADAIGAASRAMQTHQWIGLGLTVVYVGLAGWRTRAFLRGRGPGTLYLAAAALSTLFLFYQGYLGGKMTLG